ncbi:MAG: hypothetical protein KGR46_01060 [Verrucomicrobia bacterium]|nr:hypothetical protein [Verrucomicrobiota bacterium]
MLIRRTPVPNKAAAGKLLRKMTAEEERLEVVLSRYEKNLELEAFYIRKKDISSLLEILPAQGSLIETLTTVLGTIQIEPSERPALDRRLAAADAKREENRKAFEADFDTVKKEVEEMNAARLRLKQVRTLSRTAYTDDEPVRTENWA